MRIGDERIRKASAQKVRHDYETLAFRDGESVEDFALRLSGMVSQLAILGDPEPEEKVVQKYLRMARPRFKQLIISIETLLDTSTLSVEEITGRLKSAKDDPETPSGQSFGKLYVTEEEWIERYKKKEQGGGRGGSNSGGRNKRGRGRWRGRGGRSTEGSGGGSSRKMTSVEVVERRDTGHMSARASPGRRSKLT
jgi:hypothetical protein